MPAIVVLGKKNFVIGFELAGIKDTIIVDDTTIKQKTLEALQNKEIGILVMHKTDVDNLGEREQEKFEKSIRPTTVVVTEDETSDERFRKQIQEAIGVDVWDK